MSFILSLFGKFWQAIEREVKKVEIDIGSRFADFWSSIESEEILWRVSLFQYANYSAPPYFTYWRITCFFETKPYIEEIEDMERELRAYAENESEAKGWKLSKTVRREITQIQAYERNGVPFYEPRISESHGREPSIPSEDYVRFRQTRYDEFSDDDVEGDE